MEIESLRKLVLRELHGGLWHTTHPERFKKMLESGAILPVPDPPNPDGWKTLSGEPYRSYAHTLNAVSLFDFNNFDAQSYKKQCPSSSWDEFVPFRAKWGSAVWIEIDRTKITQHFISGPDLLRRNHAENAWKYWIMPYIEAAHIGPLLRTAFVRVFIVRWVTLGLPSGATFAVRRIAWP